jgi:hypothetical protein
MKGEPSQLWAIPRLKGTPIRRAIPEVSSVPRTYGSTPKDSLPTTGFQLVPVRKPNPNLLTAISDPVTRTIVFAISIMNADTAMTAVRI